MSPLDRLRWVASVASADLPGACTRLAAHLALMAADGSGAAWPSRPRLAKALGCDEARLVKAFRDLTTAGFVSRGELTGPFGRQTYRWLLVPPAESAPGAENAPGAESAGAPPAESATDPLRKAHPKGGSEGGIKEGIKKSANNGFAKPIATKPKSEADALLQKHPFKISGPKRDHKAAINELLKKMTVPDVAEFLAQIEIPLWPDQLVAQGIMWGKRSNSNHDNPPMPQYAPPTEMADYIPAGVAS